MATDKKTDQPKKSSTEVRQSSELLPKYFRTSANEKILSSTLDQLVQPGSAEKISGYFGRKTAKAFSPNDTYISDVTDQRSNRQLEPATVAKDYLGNVEFFSDYADYINQLSVLGADVSNQSNLNAQEFYAWNPGIDWDKLTNFREYFWLPNGPQTVSVFGQSKEIITSYEVTTKDQGDNTTYMFSNRLAANPTLTLYRGQTYNFNVNTPGFPIAFTVDSNFTVPDPDGDSENVSSAYTKGIKFFDEDDNEIPPQYIEKGRIEFTVPLSAPDHLFYISEQDINTSGFIKIFNIEANSKINVAEEILGARTYTSANGVEFTNGLKVTFLGEVLPEKYSKGDWYIEGVGSSITLVSEDDLIVPAAYTKDVPVPWGAGKWDRQPFDNANSFAEEKDYIVTNRSSPDKSPWSRYNKWFHSSTIAAAAKYSNVPEELDQSSRATRPIIEFEPGLRLHNFGSVTKKDVDLVDSYTTDVFSIIEGQEGYNIDGVPLVAGQRILFIADNDVRVYGKTYKVTFLNINNRKQISLIEEDDTDPANDEVVMVTSGNEYSGQFFWYNGHKWLHAQKKTSTNQQPMFELYDEDDNALSDETIYKETSFTGVSVFEYAQGTGALDPELNIPLKYRSIENVGDLEFNFTLGNIEFTYREGQTLRTKDTSTSYLRKYTLQNEYTLQTGWVQADKKSTQAIIRQFVTDADTKTFPIDVFDNSSSVDQLKVSVIVNNRKLKDSTDYTIDKTNKHANVVLTTDVPAGTNVILRVYGQASKNNNGYYEIAHNLERNPLNNRVSKFTLGEVNDHVLTISENARGFNGEIPGSNNFRDLGQLSKYGTRFVQHSGPINLANYHIKDKDANIIKAIRYSKVEYAKFKRQLLRTIEQLGFDGPTRQQLDLALRRINESKTPSMPFYFTDMIPVATDWFSQYEIPPGGQRFFALSEKFSLSELSSRAVLVYCNDVQMVHGRDYVFTQEGFVDILASTSVGDIIDIVECESTDGCFVPPTPTKLGLYKSFVPKKFVDTTYLEPRNMIQGHDGSLMLAFDDYRDDIILEYETRVYNNIKQEYNADLFSIDDFVPGDFRYTGYSISAINYSMLPDFIEWSTVAGVTDYTTNLSYDRNNSFTYNYSSMLSPNNSPLAGGWRAIYKRAYDTDRPHSHPWEMLGFSNEPQWWKDVYGPAPYTSNNLILWTDLQDGIIRQPGTNVKRDRRYVRPGLLTHLPVDTDGNLLSPLDSNYARKYVDQYTRLPFVFGDSSPTETAWRRSSEFPFSLLIAKVLNQPAATFATGFDLSRVKRNKVGQIVYTETNTAIRLADLVFPNHPEDDLRICSSGLVNYISNYLTSNSAEAYRAYKEQLTSLVNQLSIKVGGFTESQKFNLMLDSRNPLNQGNVFLPKENFQVFLNTSAPTDVVSYSGVIIERTPAGYSVKGYDKEFPIFRVLEPITSNSDSKIVIGGISEQYVKWNSGQQYVKSQNVYYFNAYYRVVVSHVSGSEFDPSKFEKMAELPQEGGQEALFRSKFSNIVKEISYGAVLPTVQDVVDFMLGYEAYLQQQGFVFDFFNNTTEQVENWKYSAKEFLFWTTQNWTNGSVIALSPGAEQIKFSREYAVVDDVFDNFYPYSLVTADGTPLHRKFITTERSSQNAFGMSVSGTRNGIYGIKLPIVQKEHVVLLDNTSVFGDVLYDPEAGYRQDRIKVTGYRSSGWNGGLNIPGFVYDSATVVEWKQWVDYPIGTVVKHKEFYYVALTNVEGANTFSDKHWERLDGRPDAKLLPNFDYSISQFEDFYDLDSSNFNVEQQQHAQHLIGYQKRQYLQNIINDDVSQYKFFQGFIQDKGTANSLTKLFDALGTSDKKSLEFYEEWAIRLGQYGDTDNAEVVEFLIDESKLRVTPQPIELVNRIDPNSADAVYRIRPFEVHSAPADYNSNPFPVVTDNPYELTSPGFVRDDDVAFRVPNSIDILNGDPASVPYGEYVWVLGIDEEWDVFQHVRTALAVTGITRNAVDRATLTFDNNTSSLQAGQFIGVQNLRDENNNFYLIDQLGANTAEVIVPVGSSIKDEVDQAGFVSTLRSVKVKDLKQANTVIQQLLTPNQRLWVSGSSHDDWAVYENNEVYSEINTLDNRNKYAVYKKAVYETISSPKIDPDTDEPVRDENGDIVYIVERVYSDPLLSENSPEPGYARSISASENNTTVIIGDPNNNEYSNKNKITDSPETKGNEQGVVHVYTRAAEVNKLLFKTTLRTPYVLHRNDRHVPASGFGSTTAISPDGRVMAVGSPTASKVTTAFLGCYDSTATYVTGDIVSFGAQFWEALDNVSPGAQNIPGNLLAPWKQVFNIPVKSGKPIYNKDNIGAYTIYEKTGNAWNLRGTYILPQPQMDETGNPDSTLDLTQNTGFKLELSQHNGLYTLFVATKSKVFIVKDGIDDRGNEYNWELNTNKQYVGDWNTAGVLSGVKTGQIIKFTDNAGETSLYKSKTNVAPAGSSPDDDPAIWELYDTNSIPEPYVPCHLTEGTGSIPPELSFEHIVDITASGNGQVLAITVNAEPADDSTAELSQVEVYRFQEGQITKDQVIESPMADARYGESISISPNGKFLVIGEPGSDVYKYDQGRVRVYSQDDGKYKLSQTLISPRDDVVEMFGFKVSCTDTAIAVTSFNGDMVIPVRFDKDASPETIFDNKFTEFSTVIKNAGSVSIYDLVDTTFMFADSLEYSDAKYAEFGESMIAVRNHVYVGLPRMRLDDTIGSMSDYRRARSVSSWTKVRVPEPIVDVNKINEIFLYDTRNNGLVTYLDYIDVRQGKIAGPAAENIDYRLSVDPARYNITSINRMYDAVNHWDDAFVGKVWWDQSTARFANPYQGDAVFQSANWNTLIPGARIDVYEWVRSTVSPTEWDELSGTNAGEAKGISGRTKYGDSAYSQKLEYDNVAKQFSNVYYFWVTGKTTVPNIPHKTLSILDITRLIEDPAQEGYRYVSLLAGNRFAIHNMDSMISGTDTALAISYYTLENQEQNVHSEYQLLTEGLGTSLPKRDIERKWVDSLVGYDEQSRIVPDPSLSPRQRYGNLFKPRQGWFINRTEALKQVIERVNISLTKLPVVDSRDLSLLFAEDSLPRPEEYRYDYVVDSVDELRFVGTSQVANANITLETNNGEVTNVIIQNPGQQYKYPDSTPTADGKQPGPLVTVTGTGTGANVKLYINALGQIVSYDIVNPGSGYTDPVARVRPVSVLVRSDSGINDRWAIYSWNDNRREWERTSTQSFKVSDYWEYIDWYAPGTNQFTFVNHVIDYSFQLAATVVQVGEIVKISNVGTGGWLLLKKVNDIETNDFTVNYETIGRQAGTIQFASTLYDNPENLVGFDVARYDNKFFDAEPVEELRIILQALKQDILIDNLVVDYNQLFFSSVRYVFSEQLNVNWAFKTSFVKAKHNVGELGQSITFRNNSLPSYNDYVEEAKPYKTNVREYISALGRTDETQSVVSDFDLPPRYIESEDKILPLDVKVIDDQIVGAEAFFDKDPDRLWREHVGFKVTEIAVADPGTEYQLAPDVRISGGGGTGATAQAYIGKGGVTKVRVINAGSGYTSSPTVTLAPPGSDTGRVAKATAILGDSVIRGMKVTVKFDRTSGNAVVVSRKQNQQFTGTGSHVIFDLTWPMEMNLSTVLVTINGEDALRSEYSFKNITKTVDGKTTSHGQVVFVKPPVAGADINVFYNTDAAMLSAADRIEHLYAPGPGMLGKHASQLMDGIDYGGVEVKGFDFDTTTGWDTSKWSSTSWDAYSTTFEDLVFTLDGSTTALMLDAALEDGVAYNVYKNGVRIDDPNYVREDDPQYDPSNVVANAHAQMRTIVGDGSTKVIDLGEYDILTLDGDKFVVRKETSDGSVGPDPTSYDTQLQGGDFNYGSATGMNAEDIIVDGDNFVTPSTSKGPEELVPGQVLDTVNIKVFERIGEGQGEIITQSYLTDGTTDTYNIGIRPNSLDAVVVRVNGQLVDPGAYDISYKDLTITFAPILPAQQKLSITTIGTNGNNVLEINEVISDGSLTSITTDTAWADRLTPIITIDGVVISNQDFGIRRSIDDKLVIDLLFTVPENQLVEYVITDEIQIISDYSQVVRDTIDVIPGETTYPVTKVTGMVEPQEYFTLVEVNGAVLTPGYSKQFVITDPTILDYRLDTFQIPERTIVPASVRIFRGTDEMTRSVDFIVDVNTSSIKFSNTLLTAGDVYDVYYTENAEYFIDNGQLELANTVASGAINVLQFTNQEKVDIERIQFTLTSIGASSFTPAEQVVYNNLRNGRVHLRSTAAGPQYVWVALNGQMLEPSVDYRLSADRKVIFLDQPLNDNDSIDVLHFSAIIQSPRMAWSKFKDILNRTHYKRYDNNLDVELAQPLEVTDLYIEVTDVSTLPEPSKLTNNPGIIFIDGERIEYFIKDTSNNTLRQLRRGTLGTGVKEVYPAGTTVIDQGQLKTIPYSDETSSEVIDNTGDKVYQTQFNLSNVTLRGSQTYNDFFEVFVGGRRLQKCSVQKYQFDTLSPTGELLGAIAPSSPEGDVEVDKEFDIVVDSVTGQVELHLTNAPVVETIDYQGNVVQSSDEKIVIVKKTGNVWSSPGTPLKQASNSIANFLRGSISKLPE